MENNNIFRKKSIEDLQEEAFNEADGKGMKKTLNATNLTMLGIGAVIGAGIFVLTGNAAAQYAGPSIILSFVLSGLACAFAGLCYAEFAAMIPIAGSAYTYAYATLGELIAWIIGWDLILEYLFAASTVAVGWSGYVSNFFKENLHITIPSSITQSPFILDPVSGWQSTGSYFNFPAVFIVTIVTTLLVIGIKESVKFNNTIVIIKVIVILLFIFFGFSYVSEENLTPFIPENTGEFGSFGWSGILRGAGVIFFSYIGFDAVSTAAQETKNPQRDMPIGILASLAVCTIIYILVAFVLTGMIDYKLLNSPNPIAIAIDSVGTDLKWLSPIIKLGAIAGLSSVVLVMLMGQPRIFYSMSKDGLLPPLFSKLHPKFKTPYISSIITGIFAALLAGFLPISLLGELVSIGTLLAFAIVCIGIMVLRVKQPNAKRPFKAPFIWITGTFGAGFAIIQMLGLPLDTWIRLFIWMALGFLIYFIYGKKNSILNKSK